jgi:glutamine amidotransferase
VTRIAIIDCGAGNLHSVRKAFASQLAEGAVLEVVTDATALATATHIVLPGVGAFADCMAGLTALPGMRAALEDAVLARKTPFLGICVGMQMLFQRGHEHGVHAGLGWFQGEVKKITPADSSLKIPHMGWNRLQRGQGYFATCHDHFYFVHSYAASGCRTEEVLASVDYGGEFVAVIGRENILATQFHPEKSQAAGLALLRHFIGQ